MSLINPKKLNQLSAQEIAEGVRAGTIKQTDLEKLKNKEKAAEVSNLLKGADLPVGDQVELSKTNSGNPAKETTPASSERRDVAGAVGFVAGAVAIVGTLIAKFGLSTTQMLDHAKNIYTLHDAPPGWSESLLEQTRNLNL